jgi:hypothetical protein
VSESQELVDQIVVFRKALNEDVKQKALGLSGSLKNTTRGKQVLLPFKIDEKHAVEAFNQWIAGRWFAPRGPGRRAGESGR